MRYEKVLKLNVYEVLNFLAHSIDKTNLKTELMKPKKDNEIQL